MFQPSFSMGAEIGGHVGTLEGNLKLEAYQNENFMVAVSAMVMIVTLMVL